MATVPVENKTDFPKHVAGTIIPPGETRFFEESMLPPYLRKPKAPVVASEPAGNDLVNDAAEHVTRLLTDLLDNPVKEVKKHLHTLTPDQLNQLDAMEQAAGNRTTLINDITNERLRRAEIESDPELSGFEKYQKVHKLDDSQVSSVDQYILNNLVEVPLLHEVHGEHRAG